MQRRILSGIGLLCALLGSAAMPSGVRADGSAPIVIGYKGDLFTWTGNPSDPLTQRTTWGYNGAPRLSPDDTTIAYASAATVYANAITAHTVPGNVGAPPENIWLMSVANLAADNAVRIADQPADASIYSTTTPDHYTIRSDPAWSPDGKSVAWTEMTVSGKTAGNYQLVVYSTQSDAATVLVPNLPAPTNFEGFTVEPVAWGNTGIAVGIPIFDSSQPVAKVSGQINVYDNTGKLLSSSAKIDNMGNFFWITDFGMGDNPKEYVAVPAGSDNGTAVTWRMIDPLTGIQSGLSGLPQLYSPNKPSGGAFVTVLDPGSSLTWQIAGAPVTPTIVSAAGGAYDLLGRMGIAPDGNSVVYVNDQHEVHVLSGSSDSVLKLSGSVSGVAWGPTAWRILHQGNS